MASATSCTTIDLPIISAWLEEGPSLRKRPIMPAPGRAQGNQEGIGKRPAHPASPSVGRWLAAPLPGFVKSLLNLRGRFHVLRLFSRAGLLTKWIASSTLLRKEGAGVDAYYDDRDNDTNHRRVHDRNIGAIAEGCVLGWRWDRL